MRAGLKSILPLLLAAGLFSNCSTPHKTYLPPSNAKVTASTKKVTDGAAAAHGTQRQAKQHVVAAQKHNDALVVTGLELQKKLDAIIKIAPPELQPALAAVKADATAIQNDADDLKTELDGAHKKQDETEAHQVKLDQDIAELKIHQGQYESTAQTLATDATNEREARITAEKQLFKEKIFSFLWKLGGGALVLGIIALIVLWWTGKLAFKFAK